MKSEVVSRRGIEWVRAGVRLAGVAGLLGMLIAPSSASAAAPAVLPQAGTVEAQRYVQVGKSGAKLYNLPDPKGHVVLNVDAGTPLVVHGDRGGGKYLKVSAPGGVEVWIYGKYLKESQRLGWVEATGNYVNMRPMPRSNNSYPLGQIDRGTRLRFIKRSDPSKPMAEDWVQVYSSPETVAYVLAAKTTALAAGVSPGKVWKEAVAAAMVVHESGSGGQPVEAARSGAPGEATEAVQEVAPQGVFGALRAADEMWNQEKTAVAPDFVGVIAAYQAVLTFEPDAPTERLVASRIETVTTHRKLADLQRDIVAADEEHEQKIADAQQKIREMQRSRDPLWGRFQTRGWLERHKLDGQKVYLVRYGSEHIARIECQSGRYDLAVFEGFEIGVRGIPIGAAAADEDGYPVIDVDRIEVISGRYVREGD
jgi:hypothetical protein